MKKPYPRAKSPLKWHGGKSYLADKIVGLMPLHRTYLELYFGGGSVLMAKKPDNISEIVNDKNGDLTNFWRVLADDTMFQKFLRRVEAIPFSQVEWARSRKRLEENPWESAHDLKYTSYESRSDYMVVRAAQFFVWCRQSMAGRMNSFAPLTQNRLRRGMNEQASAWLGAVEGLPMVHDRLKRVVILSQEATEVLAKFNRPDVVAYLDPPYPADTRVSTDVYEYEMTRRQHKEMLEVVLASKAKILLSSYPNELYERRLKDWNRHDFDLPNNASSRRQKDRKQEVVWTNF